MVFSSVGFEMPQTNIILDNTFTNMLFLMRNEVDQKSRFFLYQGINEEQY